MTNDLSNACRYDLVVVAVVVIAMHASDYVRRLRKRRRGQAGYVFGHATVELQTWIYEMSKRCFWLFDDQAYGNQVL